VVVLYIEAMKLEYERSIAEQPFVFVPTVSALTTEKLLVEAAAPLDVRHRDQGLRPHHGEV
jgi:hypothetical protein